jgi:methylenetetrahydrofolate dehydrogenase (NADP+)/methenyltetrahydrofolate cyclohydrolase
MKLLTGLPVAEKKYTEMMGKINQLRTEGITPHLAVILVGHREDSEIYVKIKEKKAREFGIEFSLYRFDEDVKQEEILQAIDYLNKDESVHGIIVQLPLPENFETDKILESVSAEKDVDGLNKNSVFSPPSPMAILELINFYNIDTRGKKIVIVGKGRLVGGPLELLMKERGLDVLAVDSDTDQLLEKIKSADILIAATGTPNIINDELVKKDMTLISVGDEINFKQIEGKVEATTPQKGGVGPITVALLLKNVVEATFKD